MSNLWKKFCSRIAEFRGHCGGQVAVIFVFSTMPVLAFIGAAIDFSRANSLKASLQNALDATALMLAREAPNLSAGDLQSKATTYFNALFVVRDANVTSFSAAYTTTGGSQVTVNGTVSLPTDIMNVVGIDTMSVTGTSTVKWGMNRLRVALALDNTGSMASDGKMTALKSATKSLLSQLKSAASQNGDVYVSIIPFADDVNVGSSNYTASWIDWADWDNENTTTTCKGRRGRSCRTTSLSHTQWNGCITDRGGSNGPTGQNYDQNVTAPGASPQSKFPADQSDNCPVQMKGLTYDWTTLNSLVDSMNPTGSTNQPIGLVWAWQSLVGGGPLTVPAKEANYQYSEIVILMSDGLNTQDRWYGDGRNVSTDVDKRMYDSKDGSGTCANIKAAGITIYSIQVNTGGDPLSTVMKNCASSTDKFWMITSANELIGVFTTIGTNLTQLRVAK